MKGDLPDFFLKCVLLQSVSMAVINTLYQMVEASTEKWEQAEEEGREAVIMLSALVAQQGGQVQITTRELEHLKRQWLQRRPLQDGEGVEYRLVSRRPR